MAQNAKLDEERTVEHLRQIIAVIEDEHTGMKDAVAEVARVSDREIHIDISIKLIVE